VLSANDALNDSPKKENNGLVINCPPRDTIVIDCLPQIPSEVRIGNAMSTSADLSYFTNLGGQIVNNCNDIVIQAQDVPPNVPVTDCSVEKVFNRQIIVYDGPPGGSTQNEECTVTYRAAVPYYLQRIGSTPPPFTISCDENVNDVFLNWLNDFGGQEFGSCSPISLVNTIPSPPVLNYGTSPTNPIGCGSLSNPGNGFVAVQFNV